jgi:1-phosphofructokinase family hexose kinase
MIVTVTVNTGVDRVLFVPSFKLNSTMRAGQSVLSMGGKATDAAWILGELGFPARALGFAAGLTGQQMVAMLEAKGVQPDFILVGGETRTNTVTVVQDTGDSFTITTSTLHVEPAHIEALRARYIDALANAGCVVIGGSLPAGVSPLLYRDFVRQAEGQGIPVILDAVGEPLGAGLAGKPHFIKPNRDELASFAGRAIEGLADAHAVGREIQTRYGVSPIITLGGAGALAVLPERTLFIPPLRVEVVNAAGSGDAVVAGLAWALAENQPVEEGLRLGFAAAAAVTLTPGTADCRRADVERLKPLVELRSYP